MSQRQPSSKRSIRIFSNGLAILRGETEVKEAGSIVIANKVPSTIIEDSIRANADETTRLQNIILSKSVQPFVGGITGELVERIKGATVEMDLVVEAEYGDAPLRKTYSGTLLNLSKDLDSAVILSEDKATILNGNIVRIGTDKLKGVDFATKIIAVTRGVGKIEHSYIARGLRWSMGYDVMFDTAKGKMQISAMVFVENDTDEAFNSVEIELSESELDMQTKRRPYVSMDLARSVQAEHEQEPESSHSRILQSYRIQAGRRTIARGRQAFPYRKYRDVPANLRIIFDTAEGDSGSPRMVLVFSTPKDVVLPAGSYQVSYGQGLAGVFEFGKIFPEQRDVHLYLNRMTNITLRRTQVAERTEKRRTDNADREFVYHDIVLEARHAKPAHGGIVRVQLVEHFESSEWRVIDTPDAPDKAPEFKRRLLIPNTNAEDDGRTGVANISLDEPEQRFYYTIEYVKTY